jgi:hypothetical protein
MEDLPAKSANEGKSFKPNLGAFKAGSDEDASDEEDEFSDEDGSDVEEFSGFAAGNDESDEEEDDADMISEPSLPSDADLDSSDEDSPVDLRGFVDSLPGGTKRKVAFEEDDVPAVADEGKKKRRVLPSMQGPGGKSEGGDFGLNPSEWTHPARDCY